MRTSSVPLLPLLVLSAACGSEPAAEPGPQSAATQSAPGPASPAAKPAAPPIDLGTLSYEDAAAADLEGELGCGFMPALGGEELWIGQGDVLPEAGAQGLIRVDGEPVELTMAGIGGYDVMADGARFTAGDLAVSFTRTGTEPLVEEPGIEMESAAFPTTMTVTRGTRKLVVEGVLECGP